MDKTAAFPFPPAGKKGWPWSADVLDISEYMVDGQVWPKISVITPNYNYGQYLEETIRSVLLQGYPNLEYIIIDGGSTDGSIDIIKKYEPWIAYWESEKDRGQAHAINKGFTHATGELLMWINSDDLLLPEALRKIAMTYDAKNEAIIAADIVSFYNDGEETPVIQHDIKLESFIGIPEGEFAWNQPGTIVPRSFYQAVGGLDETLHYFFDWDWMCRLLIHRPDVTYLHTFVARFRVHEASKTGPGLLEGWLEAPAALRRYQAHLSGIPARKVATFYHLRVASLLFCEHPGSAHYWNRWRGIGALWRAVREDASVIFDRHFVHLVIRALLPRALYRTKVSDSCRPGISTWRSK